MTGVPVRIEGTGMYVPGDPINNAEVVRRFGLDVTPEWIYERTGIRTRHWLAPDRATSDMAIEAAREALADAGRTPADVDLLLLATVTPDHPSPATASIVAGALGLQCMALDVSAACAGFLHGVDMAAAMITAGRAYNALVVAADARSRNFDPSDHRTVVLFGDAAGAAVLTRSEVPGFLGFHAASERRGGLAVWTPAGGTRKPITAEAVEAGEHFVKMESSRALFPAVREFCARAALGALHDAGLELDDIDRVVLHQGNGVLVDALLDDLGVPTHKGIRTIERYGSCSGAALPVALATARAEGQIEAGHTVLLAATGAGWTMSGAVHRF